MQLVVGISGASGAVYGVRLLEALRSLDVGVDLVVTAGGVRTLRHETGLTVDDLAPLVTAVHPVRDLGASISSGSYRCDGMVVVPCSVRSLSGIVNSYDENLLIRAADVTLKERRTLVLVVRETPLHLGHLRLLTAAAELGAVIFPPVPAFYNRPATLDDVVAHTVGRVLDQFGLDALAERWDGTGDGLGAARGGG